MRAQRGVLWLVSPVNIDRHADMRQAEEQVEQALFPVIQRAKRLGIKRGEPGFKQRRCA